MSRDFLVVSAPSEHRHGYQNPCLYVTADDSRDAVKQFVHQGNVLVFEVNDGYRWRRETTATAEVGWDDG